jgi:hypothetical protein
MVLPRGAWVVVASFVLPGCTLVSLDGLTGGLPPLDASAGQDAEAGTPAGGYAGAVLADSPLAYWRFDELTGTTAVDSSGHGNDAHYTGGVSLGAPGALTGEDDTAVSFDGVTGFVDAGHLFAFPGQVPFSIEAWVSAQASTSYMGVAASNDAAGGPPTEGYLLFVAPPGGTLGLQRIDGDNVSTAAGTSNLAGSGYMYVVAAFDGVELDVYANGELQGTQTASFAIAGAVADFVVGAEAGGSSNFFAGSLDEVAVYDHALSADRVRAHYLAGVTPP